LVAFPSTAVAAGAQTAPPCPVDASTEPVQQQRTQAQDALHTCHALNSSGAYLCRPHISHS
jgi:hypothetical protein